MKAPHRHFEADFEFPEHCDHCPRPLTAGTEYLRVQFVVDGENSVVGAVRKPILVEHSFELVLCVPCSSRLGTWIRTPLSAVPPEGEMPAELDDAELETELEKELYILGDGTEEGALTAMASEIEPGVTKWRNVSGVPIFPSASGPPIFSPEPEFSSPVPEANSGQRTASEQTDRKPCLDPDRMHGAADQFPGTDGEPWFGEEKRS